MNDKQAKKLRKLARGNWKHHYSAICRLPFSKRVMVALYIVVGYDWEKHRA